MNNIDDMELPELYARKKYLICCRIPSLLEESNKLMKDILDSNEEQLSELGVLSALESSGLADRNEESIYDNKYYSDDHYGEPKEYINDKTINSHNELPPEPSKRRQGEIMERISSIEMIQELKKTNCDVISKEIEMLALMQDAILKKLHKIKIKSDEDEEENEEEDQDEDDKSEEDQYKMQSDQHYIHQNIMNDLEC